MVEVSTPQFRQMGAKSKTYVVQTKQKRTITKWQVVTLVRRLAVIAAAILYIHVSMMATWRMMEVLRDMTNPTQSFAVFTSSLIAGYVGDGLIRASSLMQEVLGGDTTPRDYMLFLESETKTSTEGCSDVPLFPSELYNYQFLGHGFSEIVNDTSYNITILKDLELVVVVVDCTFTPLTKGDWSVVRGYDLMRSRQDPSELYLLMASMSVQDYEVRAHHKYGPGLLGMLTVVHDMRDTDLEQFYLVSPTYPYQRSLDFEPYEFVRVTGGYLELRSVPQDPLTQPVKYVHTTRKRGFYNGDVQSNINFMYTLLDIEDAKTVMTKWEWFGEATTTDSWAWVHGLHLYFGLQTISSLVVLSMLSIISYHNFRAGKIWIGDPFASVSTTTFVVRGVLVLVSWYMDAFWSIFELAMANGAAMSENEIVYLHKELVYADVLVGYLGLVGILSSAIRERIDPGIAIFLFEVVQLFRLQILHAFSSVVDTLVSCSENVFLLGNISVPDAVYNMSPMDFWSAFQIPAMDFVFISASFFPRIILLVSVLGYAILRKIYWRYYPDEAHPLSGQSANRSANERAALAQKGHLTNFEISTGAELQTRFGIISDYSNYVFFKGMKFASADGVYCSGYVIVNGRFLVGSKDLLAISMMKSFGVRFAAVYAFEVEGNTVKDTARLVYPETFTWSDLWHLNVAVLL